MKKLLIVLSLLIVGVNANAQKFIKIKKARVPYIQVPLDYSLLDNHKKFYIRYVEEELNPFKNKSEIENLVNMPGFEKSELKENSDFTILIEEVSNKTQGYKLDKNKRTSKEGVVTYTYTAKSTLVNTFRIKLVDKSGSLIHSETASSTAGISSNVCSSSSEATKKYKAALGKVRSSNRKKGFSSTLGSVNDKYCYLNRYIFINFVGVKYKKYDYSEINTIAEEGLVLLAKAPTEESIAKVKGYISVFEKELENWVDGDKKARVNTKVKALLQFNIGLGYFYIEDYEKAVKYIELSYENANSVANRQMDLMKAATRNVENKR